MTEDFNPRTKSSCREGRDPAFPSSSSSWHLSLCSAFPQLLLSIGVQVRVCPLVVLELFPAEDLS